MQKEEVIPTVLFRYCDALIHFLQAMTLAKTSKTQKQHLIQQHEVFPSCFSWIFSSSKKHHLAFKHICFNRNYHHITVWKLGTPWLEDMCSPRSQMWVNLDYTRDVDEESADGVNIRLRNMKFHPDSGETLKQALLEYVYEIQPSASSLSSV